MKTDWAIRIVFLVSGASALAYEVIWTKWVTLVIGVTTFCVGTVIASFLTGLALGGFFFGRRIDRGGRPLRVYAWLEVGVGGTALILWGLLPWLEGLYVFLHRHSGSSLEALRLVRLLVCFVVLLPPTFLMGGTLPVLCRREVLSGLRVSASLSALYALNTLGGMAGTLLTGFVLIPTLGVAGTLMAAVAGNWAAAGIAFALDAREAARPAAASTKRAAPAVGPPGAARERPVGEIGDRGRRILLGVAGLSGFAALAYEVIWTRALGIFLRSGIVYSFALMLATFLFGIVVGSWLYHRFLESRDPGTPALAWLEIGIGAWGLVSIPLLAQIGDLPGWVQKHLGSGSYSWGEWTIVWVAASIGMMILPCILMGVAYPLLGRLVIRSDGIGAGVGVLSAVNGVGSVLGAALTGFLLIPRWGTLNSLRAASFLSLFMAALALLAPAGGPKVSPGRRRLVTLAATGAVAASSLFLPPDLIRSRILASRPGENLFFAEGAAGLVEIYELTGVEGNRYRKLYFNGTSYAGSTQSGRRYHRLLGALPALLHPDPKTGLVIGFGSGMTFGAMMQDPRIRRVDCVELSPEVLQGSGFFAADNGNARDDPKGRVLLGDGREHLLVTPERYDLISLEPPPPRFAGVVNLYSVDFYRLCRSRLRPGGLMTQWIPMHSHTVEEMRDLIRSFLEVFPEASFWAPTQRDGILVGSTEPIRIGESDLRRRMAAPTMAGALREIDIPDLGALLGGLLLDAPALSEYVRDADLITDDRPRIEYFAGHELVERPLHLEDLFRRGINPAQWLTRAGGGADLALSQEELRHLQAMQMILLGGVASDRGDLAAKKEAYAQALRLHPDSVFIRRLNQITGTPEE